MWPYTVQDEMYSSTHRNYPFSIMTKPSARPEPLIN